MGLGRCSIARFTTWDMELRRHTMVRKIDVMIRGLVYARVVEAAEQPASSCGISQDINQCVC